MNQTEDSFEQELSAFFPAPPRREWFHQVRETMDREYEEHGFAASSGLRLLPMTAQDVSAEYSRSYSNRHDRRWMAVAAALMLAGPLMVIKMQPQPAASATTTASSATIAAPVQPAPVADKTSNVLPASTSSVRREVSPAQDRGLVLYEGRPYREYTRETVEIHNMVQPQTGDVIRVEKPITQIFRVPVGN